MSNPLNRMTFDDALDIALRAKDQLERHFDRLELGGSLRRRERRIGDIELVGQPALTGRDLYGEPFFNRSGIYKTLRLMSSATRVQGLDRYAKCFDVYDTSLNLDLFMIHPPAQWGVIHLIRTGPAEFSQRCMTRLINRGYRCKDGMIRKEGERAAIDTPEEMDVFKLMGMEFVIPEARSAGSFK